MWLIQIVLVWRNEFNASVPWSLDNDPDCLYPPKGVLISPSEKVLTDTVPQGKLLAKWNARLISWVNTFSEGDIKTPFGGYKQSGSLSRDQGTEALNSFLQTKTIWISHNS